MFVKITVFLLEVFASHYCVCFLHIVSMIIQSYIKPCFYLTYILLITQNVHYQIYNANAGTIHVVEYLIYFLTCWLLKVVLGTCFQFRDLRFFRNGEHFPGFSFCICLFLTLLYLIWFLRFLFDLNVVVNWQLNTSFREMC